MPRCRRCGDKLDARGGLLAALGLDSVEGYECTDCGTLLCTECFRDRTVELAGAGHDRCPACDGTLLKR